MAALVAAAVGPPLPAAASSVAELAMMDDMMQMKDPKGGQAGSMQPRPGTQSMPGGMQAPMSPPDPMGTMRGNGRGQELWMLTAADTPDAAKIEAQVRAVERLRGDQRLAYIRAVGEAANVLTPEQRAALLGTSGMSGKPATAPMQHK